jgi:uncharacterized DUF497 family protein
MMKTRSNFTILTIQTKKIASSLLGLSFEPWVLVVCHCFRESETVIRIISARKADKDEELEYWKQRK